MKIKFLFIYLFLLSNYSFSQKTGPKIEKIPHEFTIPYGKIDYDETNLSQSTDWIIHSDRDNNKTYNKANLNSGEKKTIQFLDRFYVTDVQGNFLHIYKFGRSKSTKRGNVLPADAEDMGWIEKSKVILWTKALLTHPGNIVIKALPAIQNEEVLKNIKAYIKEGEILLYNDPHASKPNKQHIKMFDFLYVYKLEENNRILVGRSLKINLTDPTGSILGWVDKKIIKQWGDRICLEPNWEQEAVIERQKENIKSTLLGDEDAAKNYQKNGKRVGTPLWEDDPYNKRKNPQWKRFPVIETVDNIIETGVLTGVLDENGEKVVDLDKKAQQDEIYNNKRAQLRKINMVFVIDGSEAVGDYLPSIMQAIRSVKEEEDNIVSDNNRFFGVILYRDDEDASCGQDIEKQNLTANPNDIYEFLEASGKNKGCSGNTDKTQAVRHGLFDALKMLDDGEKIENSNFIILIGGAGDKPETNDTKYPNKVLARMMAKVQAHLLVYQVNSADDPAYKRFVIDNKKLFIQASNEMKNLIMNDPNQKGVKDFKPDWGDPIDENTYRINYSTSPTYASIVFPTQGEAMKTEVLTRELDNIMDGIYTIIEDKIQGLANRFDGMGAQDIEEIPPSIRILLYSLSKSSDPNVLREYMNDNYQFFIKAYTTINCQQLSYPLYKRVLFISQDEYEDLLIILGKFSTLQGEDKAVQRGLLQNAFKEILLKYYGNEAKDAISKMNADDILKLVTGLKTEESKIFSKLKISDITNAKKLPDEKLFDIINELNIGYNKYRSVRNNDNFRFKRGDDVWYWLPEDYLP